jgi:hypothetical protein
MLSFTHAECQIRALYAECRCAECRGAAIEGGTALTNIFYLG